MSARGAAIALGYVAATALAFPHPVGERVLDLGLVLAWLSPAFLLLAIDGLAPARALRRGFALGWVAHAIVLHWAWVVTVRYGGVDPVLGLLAPPGMALYPALFVGAFAALASALRARGASGPFAFAALFTALDHARSWLLGGFPWATIGYAQHENPALLGLAAATGVYGLSFAVALGGAALARIARARRIDAPALAALGGVALLHAAGLAVRPAEIPADAPRVRIGAVQGNVPQDAKWVRERFATTLADYEEGTRVAAEQGARLVAWPESAITRLLELDGAVRERIESLARSTGAALVVGSVGSDTDALGRVTDYYDSAFAVAPDGGWVDRYDKTHLVPFGEYLPLRSLLERIATAIATGIASGDVTAGERPRAVDVPLAGGAADGIEAARTAGRVPASVRIGIPVCYELLFPDLVRRFARDGASVLVAITNDAWYGRTGAPYQFLAMTALRSAETGLWTVRAANTGVSAVIDERGRVREETRIFEPAVLVADVPLRTAAGGATPYVRFGDVFAYGCYVVAACAGLVARRGAARSAGGADAAEG